MRNFGIETDRETSGGHGQLPGPLSRDTQRDSNVIRLTDRKASQRVQSDLAAASQRGPFIQGVIDFTTIVFGVIFVSSLACSLPLAIFMLWFAMF